MPVNDISLDPDIKYDHYIDAKGLNCPLPILKTKVLLNKIKPGEIIFVESTDPHSRIDFEAYCARTNHELINIIEDKGVWGFYIKNNNH